MRTVGEILDGEFAQIARDLQRDDLRKLRSQAQHLELSAGHLSRLKRGLSDLTPALAERIAGKLRPDASTRHALTQELLAIREEVEDAHLLARRADFINEVEKFFIRIQRPSAVLCIDYRDLPRGSKFPQLARALARAIANGLSVAMFQPFGRDASLMSRSDQRILVNYVDTLREDVREIYQKVRDLSIIEADSERAAERLVLYEASRPVLSGFASRIFYVENYDPRAGREESVWEWIAAAPTDYFLRRDSDSLPSRVFSQQFSAVLDHWRDKGSLPLELSGDTENETQNWVVYRNESAA